MKLALNKFSCALLLVAAQSLSALGGDFLVHEGDHVVFLGDSITEQRLYTTYIEAYATTRHPNWKLTFRNVGWGGDTSWLRQRSHPDEAKLFAADADSQQKIVEDSVGRGLKRDVIPLKPSLVLVKFGMNDHSYQPFREDIFKAYVRSQTEIAKELKESGARVAFLTPQPIEEKKPNPDKDARNQSLRKFSDGLKDVAAQTGSAFVDQFDPYMAIMLHERATDPSAFIGGGDAVHPGPIGHTVMAWAVLKGMGATASVSRAQLDIGAKKVVAAAECKIEHLKVSGSSISFDRLDNSLPMPIDERAEAALKLAPIADDLNAYILQIAGLSDANYEVTIDGESAGKVSRDELAKGWNLSDAPGPITKQAREVLKLIFDKNNTYFRRWRDVQLFTFPNWAQTPGTDLARAEELAKLDQKIGDLEKKINQARKPKSHHFELKPAQ